MTIEELETDDVVMRRLLDDSARLGATDPEAARGLVCAARLLARARCNDSVEGEALYQLALFAHRSGEAEQAFAFASEAVALVAPHGPSVTLAWSHHVLGVVHYLAGNHATALDHGERSLAIYRATDHVVKTVKHVALQNGATPVY